MMEPKLDARPIDKPINQPVVGMNRKLRRKILSEMTRKQRRDLKIR